MNYEQALLKLAMEDERIIVMTAENRAAIRNLAGQLGERFVDFGICEQTMVGAAAGCALRGRIPIVHALAAFLTMRAFEFIRTDVGIARLPVKLIGGVPGFLSEANGPTHQAVEDISLMRGIPGMDVFCPSDEDELAEGLPEIILRPNPCYIRFNASKTAVKHHEPLRFGKAEILSQGNDLTILAFGTLLKEAAITARLVESRGIGVRFINMRTIMPIDGDAVIDAAMETGMIVTIEDHFRVGGLFSTISEILQLHQVVCPIYSISLQDRWFQPGLLPEVLSHKGFSGDQMASAIIAKWESIYKRRIHERSMSCQTA